MKGDEDEETKHRRLPGGARVGRLDGRAKRRCAGASLGRPGAGKGWTDSAGNGVGADEGGVGAGERQIGPRLPPVGPIPPRDGAVIPRQARGGGAQPRRNPI